MYQELIDLLRDQETLLNDLDALQENIFSKERILGVNVGVDRYWSRSYLTRYLSGSLTNQQDGAPLTWRFLHHFGDFPDVTLSYRPPRWGHYCLSRGYSPDASPIYFKFLLQEAPDKTRRVSFPVQDLHRHPVLSEYRPPTIVHSSIYSGGSKSQLAMGATIWSSGAQLLGTAGGFLHHPSSGQAYLVSCSHILGSVGSDVHFPPPTTRGRSNVIGHVALNFPSTLREKVKCSPASLKSIAQLDMGLVELRPEAVFDPEIPGLGRPQMISSISEMGPYDPVVAIGSSSGLVKAELGELCIWHEAIIENKPGCFRNLITLTPPYPYYAKDTHLFESGDSGAWVINTTTGLPAWDGMIIGSDGSQAYACFAENIIDACTERLNHTLAVIL